MNTLTDLIRENSNFELQLTSILLISKSVLQKIVLLLLLHFEFHQ